MSICSPDIITWVSQKQFRLNICKIRFTFFLFHCSPSLQFTNTENAITIHAALEAQTKSPFPFFCHIQGVTKSCSFYLLNVSQTHLLFQLTAAMDYKVAFSFQCMTGVLSSFNPLFLQLVERCSLFQMVSCCSLVSQPSVNSLCF